MGVDVFFDLFLLGFGLVIFVLLHELITHGQVLEHALDLLREVVPAFNLELLKKCPFAIQTRALLEEQPPAKTSEVEFLEDILRFGIPEQEDDFINQLFQLGIIDHRLYALHVVIEELSEEFSRLVGVLVQYPFEGFLEAQFEFFKVLLVREDLLYQGPLLLLELDQIINDKVVPFGYDLWSQGHVPLGPNVRSP